MEIEINSERQAKMQLPEEQIQVEQRIQNQPEQQQENEQIQNEQNGAEVEKKKEKKNKKKNKKKQQEEEELTDYECNVQDKMKFSIVNELQRELPEHLRQRYAYIEANPYNIIVEPVPPRTSISELREYFNTLIVTYDASLEIPPPIKNLDFSETKSFAIVTCSNIKAREILKQIMAFNPEIDYTGGHKMTLMKCKQFFRKFVDTILEQTKEREEGEKNGNKPVDDEQEKIYMGGFPTYLKEEQIKSIAQTYGDLKFFSLVKDQSDDDKQISKGYCFFQYVNSKNTEKAIKGLNGLEVGDRKLKVQRATQGQTKKFEQEYIQQTGQKGPEPTNASGSFLGGCLELIQKSNVQEMFDIPEYTSVPSPVIQFLNMISPEDLFEDDLYDDLKQDLIEECSKFGPIEELVIPRPCKITGIAPPSVGKVFIKFKYLIPAKRARHALSGRTYNRRTVISSFYPDELFKIKHYLINP